MEQARANRYSPILLKGTIALWYGAVALLLAAGWMMRDQKYVVAESGIGYWLGIIGGSMMLLLLVYPLRKRFSRWSFVGSVKSWFRIHMILGLAGPMLVVFHSGFRLGSFNSRVAFFSMVIVATSGVVGRLLYQRVHHGLYGRKVRFDDLYAGSELPGIMLDSSGEIDFALVEEFDEIEKQLLQRHTGVNRSIGFYRRMGSRISKLQRAVVNSRLDAAEKRLIFSRLKGLRSICRLGINEILFSYWHVLHLPLFIMLILSGFTHVVVVHLY